VPPFAHSRISPLARLAFRVFLHAVLWVSGPVKAPRLECNAGFATPCLDSQALGAINSISRCARAVPRLKEAGLHSQLLLQLLRAAPPADLAPTADLRKLTLAW
jgi:hypothetical protein